MIDLTHPVDENTISWPVATKFTAKQVSLLDRYLNLFYDEVVILIERCNFFKSLVLIYDYPKFLTLKFSKVSQIIQNTAMSSKKWNKSRLYSVKKTQECEINILKDGSFLTAVQIKKNP